MNISEIEKCNMKAAKSGHLRTVRSGGYDKQDALRIIDKYNEYIYILEKNLKNKKSGLPYTKDNPPKFELPRTVLLGGFDKHDVNVYIEALIDKMNMLVEELGE